MAVTPLFIVDEFAAIVQNVDDVLFPILNKHINYTYGKGGQIVKSLKDLGVSPGKYPLIALIQPFREYSGKWQDDTKVKGIRIIIATLTNSTSPPFQRYSEAYKPILQPIYTELINQIALYRGIVENTPQTIIRTKLDNQGLEPIASGINDYIDTIEIEDMELTFNKKRCSQQFQTN